MARLLNSLPEGDLTGSAYDPKGTPWAKRAKSTLDSILQSVEAERQRRTNQSILQSILTGGGFGGPLGTPSTAGAPIPKSMPVDLNSSIPQTQVTVPGPGGGMIRGLVDSGDGPVAIDPNAPAQPVAPKATSILSRMMSGIGGMFDPNASPSTPTDLQKEMVIQELKNRAIIQQAQIKNQQTNKGPTDFQLWQQAQKEVLAEAGGSALAGVADEKERAQLRAKAMQRFKDLKTQFTPGATPPGGGDTGAGGGSPQAGTGASAKPKGGYAEGTEAFNPRTGQKIKLVNGKWVPIK